jgi:hypothetical protein
MTPVENSLRTTLAGCMLSHFASKQPSSLSQAGPSSVSTDFVFFLSLELCEWPLQAFASGRGTTVALPARKAGEFNITSDLPLDPLIYSLCRARAAFGK